jgi:MscS family membrane protein
MEALRTFLGSDTLYHLAVAVILFIGALVVGWIAKGILALIGRKWASRTKNPLDDAILSIFLDRIKWLAVVAGAYLATSEVAKATDAQYVMARQVLKYAQGIIFVCFVLVVTLVLIRIAEVSIKHALEKQAGRASAKVNAAFHPLARRLVSIVIGLIAIIIIFDHFGQDVSSLVVSLGVGSLAIALAAQETLANMIAGFVIMMDRPFRVGDRIQLPTGEMGDVYEIGIRSTKILSFDNNLIISPNADLVKSRVTNFSYPQERVRLTVEVGVAYGTDVDRARLIISELAKSHPHVLHDPIPEVFLVEFGDSSLNLRLVCFTEDYRNRFRIETALREQIYKAFLEEGIEIPFPQRVVHHPTNQHAPVSHRQKRTTARRKGV